MRKVLNISLIVLLFIVLLIPTMGSSSNEKKTELIMFHAGSLSVPFDAMEKIFEDKYPDIDLKREAAGSTKCARKITDDKRTCDIMASADYKVIDKYLLPEHSDWNIRFATNQLVLCYIEGSKHNDKVNADNWYEILQKEGVKWGHTDPNLDPCGYRALMVMQLAEKHYKMQGLYDKLISIRPKEHVYASAATLVSDLQAGKLDYAWEYLSVAVQHKVNYVLLPEQINLSDYKYNDFYAQAVVEVTGKKKGTVETKKGKSITYGITILKNAQNRKAAVHFLELMLHPEVGLKILNDMGQPPFTPGRVASDEMMKKLPPDIQKLTEVKK